MVVFCSYDSLVISGYLVLVQLAGSYAMMVKESRNVFIAVEVDGLADGLYNVTVFPLIVGSGLVGSSVAHTELVNVSIPATTSHTSDTGT